jgi:hypothetical protein
MGRRTKQVVAVGGALALLVLAGCSDDDDLNPNNPRRPAGDGDSPIANVDHWHAAYGFYVCDEFLPVLPEFESPGGMHSHGDGVVHIHPFAASRAGDNATLMNFLDDAGVTLTEDELGIAARGVAFPEGAAGTGTTLVEIDESITEGDTDCSGESAELVVARWDDVQCDTEGVEHVTEGFEDLRFERDGEGYTIAFVPEGADIPPPPSSEDLAALGAADSAEFPADDPACD